MPADVEELQTWIDSVCITTTTYANGCTSELRNLSADYAEAVARDLGAALLYGPSYSRQAWENFCDSVRAWHRADYQGAQLFRERAEAAAGRSRTYRSIDGRQGAQVRVCGEWWHATGPSDVSRPHHGTQSASGCGWCYLGAGHTEDAHEQSARAHELVP